MTVTEITEASSVLAAVLAELPPEDTASGKERAAYLHGALAAWRVVTEDA
jgi:hypothetical protein